MSLWVCLDCTTAFAVGAPRCPHCGSERHAEQHEAARLGIVHGTPVSSEEDTMPKITRHGGPSIAGEPGPEAVQFTGDEAVFTGGEGVSAGEDSSNSSETAESKSATGETSKKTGPSRARTTGNRSGRARTAASTARTTAGDPTTGTSATDSADQ